MSEACTKCGGTNTYWKEDHPDTSMNEMVLKCRDCAPKPYVMPWYRKLREHFMFWRWRKYDRIGKMLLRWARWWLKQGLGYCSWCGRDPGFDSSIGRGRGKRCTSCGDF